MFKRSVHSSIFQFKYRLLSNFCRNKCLVSEFAAGHIVSELPVIQVTGKACCYHLSVPKNRKPVGDLKYFVQFVADKQNGDPLCFQLQNDIKECIDFFSGKRRGRLIHNDQPGIKHKSTADGYHLLLGHRQSTHFRIQIHIKIDLGHSVLSNSADIFPTDEFFPGSHLCIQRQIFRNGKIWKQGEVLVYYLDPHVNGIDRCDPVQLFTVELDGPSITLVYSGDYLDDRGFPASVLAGKAMDLTGCDLQRYIPECMNISERNLHMLRFQ